MKIKYHIALLLLACSLGGLGLALNLYRLHMGLERESEILYIDENALHEIIRLEENLRQWLIMSDLIYGSGETYLIDGTLELAILMNQIIVELHHTRICGSWEESLELVEGIIERNTGRLNETLALDDADRSKRLEKSLWEFDGETGPLIGAVETMKEGVIFEVDYKTAHLADGRKRFETIAWTACLIYIILVGLLWRLTTKTLIRPLLELTDAAATASQNDKPLRTSEKGPEEVKRLTQSITLFATSLEEKIRELSETNRALEYARSRTEEALRDSHSFTTAIMNSTIEGIVTIDEKGRIQVLNRAAEKLFGYHAGEVVGRNIATLGPNLTDTKHDQHIRRYLDTGKSEIVGFEREIVGSRCDGSEFPMMLRVAEMNYQGQRWFVGCVQDISERKIAETILRRSEERFRNIFECSSDAVLLIDVERDCFLDVNPRACGMFEYTRGELMNLSPTALHEKELDEYYAFCGEVMDQNFGHSEVLTCQTKSGSLIPVEISASSFVNAEGKKCILALVRDITERKQADAEREQMHKKLMLHATELECHQKRLESEISQRKSAQKKLKHDAYHDTLTSLPNRAFLKERIDQCIARMQTDPDYICGILFLDIDNFKIVNDSLGHDAGDELLVETAKRLNHCLRNMDAVGQPDQDAAARLGGDEFVILLDGMAKASDAARVAERIQNEMSYPFQISGQDVIISASIGIAIADGGSEGADDLLRDADTAMYRAKLAGKAQHAVFDEVMHADVAKRLKLENDLRHALLQDEFIILYQPIVSLETGRICAFESLIRWIHPERGMISPAEFIPLTEELGLIVKLGQWVIAKSCRQLAQWFAECSREHPLTMSVNVSRRQLEQPGFAEEVRQILEETGLDGKYLKLEVTESMIVKDSNRVVEVLHQLRAMDIKIAMDDFGTGQSSLSCLHEYPLDELKIDRSFIANMDGNREYAAIVHAIITLAQNLGMKVVAEGIETEEQLANMIALDCDFAQGYLFSKPVPADEAKALIDQIMVMRRAA